MRNSKRQTIITSAISLMVLLGILYLPNSSAITYDILIAIFGGSIMGFIISLNQYYSDKSKYMKEFYDESEIVLILLSKLKYCEEIPELIMNCINEEAQNKKANILLAKTIKHMNRDKLIEEHKNELYAQAKRSSESCSPSDCQIWYENTMKYYYNYFEECFDSYIEVSNTSLRDLESAYYNLDFILDNKKVRKNIHNNIYIPIYDFRESILQSSFYFQLRKKREDYFEQATGILIEENNKWFKKIEEEKGLFCFTNVYFKYWDDLSVEIEKFRCDIYGKIYKKRINIPVYSYMRNKSFQ